MAPLFTSAEWRSPATSPSTRALATAAILAAILAATAPPAAATVFSLQAGHFQSCPSASSSSNSTASSAGGNASSAAAANCSATFLGQGTYFPALQVQEAWNYPWPTAQDGFFDAGYGGDPNPCARQFNQTSGYGHTLKLSCKVGSIATDMVQDGMDLGRLHAFAPSGDPLADGECYGSHDGNMTRTFDYGGGTYFLKEYGKCELDVNM